MRNRWVVLIAVLLVFSLIGLSGCSQEKPATAPTEKETAQQGQTTDNLEDVFKSASGVKGLSCDIAMAVTTQGQPLVNQSKMWMTGKKLRIDSEMEGMKTVTITNENGEVFFYDVNNNTVMKMSNPNDDTKTPTDWTKDAAKYKIVGREKIDGQDCVVVAAIDPSDKTKMWIRKDYGLPVKVETVDTTGSVLVEYKNYNLGAQPDEVFKIPAGAKMVEMPNLKDFQVPGM